MGRARSSIAGSARRVGGKDEPPDELAARGVESSEGSRPEPGEDRSCFGVGNEGGEVVGMAAQAWEAGRPMNRAERRAMGQRGAAFAPGRVWANEWECLVCGLCFVHVEVSPEEDDADGLPAAMRRCSECGGKLDCLGPVPF